MKNLLFYIDLANRRVNPIQKNAFDASLLITTNQYAIKTLLAAPAVRRNEIFHIILAKSNGLKHFYLLASK